MENKLHCENIKSDLKYLNSIIHRQERKEPTPDVERFQKQVMFKKELCRIEMDSIEH